MCVVRFGLFDFNLKDRNNSSRRKFLDTERTGTNEIVRDEESGAALFLSVEVISADDN